MKPRLFVRLLQPVGTGSFVVFFAAFILLVNRAVFHLAWPREDLFVTGVVTLPLLLGLALTSCTHAVLHRPFALLLPGLLLRIRHAAAVAYVGFALLLMLVARLVEPRAPLAAVFGLVLALLTINCANRRQGFPALGAFGLLVGGLAFAGGWCLFHLEFAHRLLPAMMAAPWAFLFGGVALAMTSFSLGFARRTLRDRSATPHFASAVTWAAMFDRTTLRRQFDESIKFNARRGIGRRRHARAWSVSAVGPSLRDWFRVLDHQRAMTAHRQYFVLFVTYVIMIAFLTAMFGVLGLIDHQQAFHIHDFFATLADLTSPGGSHHGFNVNMVNAVIVIGLFMPYIQRGFVPRPIIPYPIGRARLADVIFAHTGRQLLASLILPSAAYWASSVIGQAVTGKVHPAWGIADVAVIDLTLLPLLPLFGLTQFSGEISTRRGAINISGSAFFIGLGAAVLVVFVRASGGTFVLSVPGFAVVAIATIAGLAWLRSRIRRHYRSCDLTAEAALAAPFGVASTR